VDDGSTERTAAVVERWVADDARVRPPPAIARWEGSAVRHGMLAAKGVRRFMTVAPEDWPGSQEQSGQRGARRRGVRRYPADSLAAATRSL